MRSRWGAIVYYVYYVYAELRPTDDPLPFGWLNAAERIRNKIADIHGVQKVNLCLNCRAGGPLQAHYTIITAAPDENVHSQLARLRMDIMDISPENRFVIFAAGLHNKRTGEALGRGIPVFVDKLSK